MKRCDQSRREEVQRGMELFRKGIEKSSTRKKGRDLFVYLFIGRSVVSYQLVILRFERVVLA